MWNGKSNWTEEEKWKIFVQVAKWEARKNMRKIYIKMVNEHLYLNVENAMDIEKW